MMQIVVLAGLAWFLMRDSEGNENGQDDPPTPPTPPVQTSTDIERWSGEHVASGPGGDYVVWFYETGIRYADGTEEYDPVKIVIGNPQHDGFLAASVGGITIGDSNNVQTFSDLETASAKADLMANPPETSPSSGVESDEEVEVFVAEQDTFVEGGYVDFGKGVSDLGQNAKAETLYDM